MPIETESTRLGEPWWWKAVQCPRCGRDPGGPAAEGSCASCGQAFAVEENRIEWRTSQSQPRYDAAVSVGDRIRRTLNPLSTPLLPFRYWAAFRLRRYYQRTLRDRTLAEEFRERYLGGLDLPAGATILDHGCGIGRNVGLLNQLGFHVVGQDVSAYSWWRRLPQSGFQVVPSSLARLPWKDSSFHAALDIMVLQYLTHEALNEHAAAVRKILKDGGHWIILDANPKTLGRHAFGKNLLALDAMRAVAEKQGFAAVDESYQGFYAPVFPRAVNYVRRLCAPWPFDVSDHRSWIARQIQPERRGLWLLRLKRL